MQLASPRFTWYSALPEGAEHLASWNDPTRRSASWYLHRLPARTGRLVDFSCDPVVSLEVGALGTVERSVEGESDVASLVDDTLTLTPAFAACEWNWSGNSFEILDVYVPHEMLQVAWTEHFSGEPGDLNFSAKLRLDDPGLLFLMKSLHCVARTSRRDAALVYQVATRYLIACLLGLDGSLVARSQRRCGLATAVRRRVLDYIDEHLEADISIDGLAAVAGLSTFHFLRQFRRSTGQTPHRYIVQHRLVRARELLLKTELPVIEIALRCGFDDPSHFARRFREQFRMAPSAFRRCHS
ncbi:MAG: AraC family transcriptional regulator [Steroidobacteraceae bacterium]